MSDYSACSIACGFHPRAATPVACKCGALIAQNDEFKELLRHYVYAVTKESAQLSIFRPRLVWKAQEILGAEAPKDLERAMWCALANTSHQFFSEVALDSHWDDLTLQRVLDGWYQLTLLAWTGSEHRTASREIVEAWSKEFGELIGTPN